MVARVLRLTLVLWLVAGSARAVEAPAAHIVHIQLDDQAITPVIARFTARALKKAEASRASYVLIELDTPGGLVSSTQEIVKNMLDCSVPIVVYVAPSGARAASAGLFIVLASDVAAMAPATHIGAAHPVRLGPSGGSPGGQEQASNEALDDKIEQDTRAWARALAQKSGRNPDYAERAVSESLSLTDSEAFDAGLVEHRAADLEALLGKLEGARGARLDTMKLTWDQQLLAGLANPNVAFLLMMLGFYALVLELYTAGIGAAGVVGGVCLILGSVGLAMLPLNYGGLALILVGLGLLVAEVFVTSFGLLTVGGVSCLILGGMMLVDSPTGFLKISTSLLVPVALATGAVTVFVLGKALKAQRTRVRTGREGLLGSDATALEAFREEEDRYTGTVRAHGELWKAVSERPVRAEEHVTIERQDGLTLTVHPKISESGGDS